MRPLWAVLLLAGLAGGCGESKLDTYKRGYMDGWHAGTDYRRVDTDFEGCFPVRKVNGRWVAGEPGPCPTPTPTPEHKSIVGLETSGSYGSIECRNHDPIVWYKVAGSDQKRSCWRIPPGICRGNNARIYAFASEGQCEAWEQGR